MQLKASLMSQSRYDEPLATISVESDSAESWTHQGEGYKRTIIGRIERIGSIWADFTSLWSEYDFQPYEENGKRFFLVKDLQIEYDFYDNYSWINIEGDQISILVFETFTGTESEYYQMIRERNEKIVKLSKEINHFLSTPVVTRNDFREFMGWGRDNAPHLDEPMPHHMIEELFNSELNKKENFRNVVF